MRLISLCPATIIFFASVGFAGDPPAANPPELVQMWASDAVFKVPESVLFDPAGDVLYVANINGAPTAKNGEGFISRLALDGEIEALRWAVGLNAPKGMGISERTLYVTNMRRRFAPLLRSDARRLDCRGNGVENSLGPEVGRYRRCGTC